MPSKVAYCATVITPIKINLALHIIGERSDGYHLLDSLVCFSLDGDVLQYRASEENRFSIFGPQRAGLTCASDNLVEQARDIVSKNFFSQSKPCELTLEKKLPVASGVGGGSGDAAGVFQLLKREWAIKADDDKWFRLALSLGADVPMCLSALRNQKPLRVSGIGEKLQPLDHVCCLPMVLVNHGQSISTAQIFKLLGRKKSAGLDIDLSKLNVVHLLVKELEKTHNDLYDPALRLVPELDEVLAVLRNSGALLARMSGSGATCFGIYENMIVAKEAAIKIAAQKPHWFVKAVETTNGIQKQSGRLEKS